MRMFDGMKIFVFGLFLTSPAQAFGEMELAEKCRAAVAAGDDAAFKAAADELLKLRHVFDTKAVSIASECLTTGFGTEWGYSYPKGRFVSQDELDAEEKAAEEAKAATDRAIAAARAEADAEAAALAAVEAEHRANAQRVAELVYTSCATLLERDQVAAMTNATCIDSFLLNGLPPT